MARTEIDGGQVQDESLTGADILDNSVKIQDLENYTFSTLLDVQVTTPEKDDLVIFDDSDSKYKNKKVYDLKLFYKRKFTATEDIYVPVDKVLQIHSPIMDGELTADGEVYIL